MIAPTIIIGLGGIGSDICCRVSKLVQDESQRKRLRFVCIDTDINDLRQRAAEDPRIITIQTSAPYTVGNYLNTNTYARDEWFPVHNILKGKTPTEGAGQVRAISRLAFDTAVREGAMNALDKAIEELYHLDGASEPQAIRVMIVSTLAGGTGSGIVLPVALYVRHFLQTRFHKNASVVRGFFLLPEIMFGNKSPEECSSLCCNAYASMRELDSFMRRGDGALSAKYKNLRVMMPDSTTSSYVDYNVSPFNFCFLYDKRNTDDLQLMSFVDYKEHAANTIYTQTLSGISSRSNSNEDNTIKALVSSNGRNRFCGAGSSLMKYPRDSVLEYIASNWACESMGSDWLKTDQQFKVEEKNQKLLKKKNPSLKIITRGEFYMRAIENAEKGSFEEYIKEMCFKATEGKNGLSSRSMASMYLSSLNTFIGQQIQLDAEVTREKKQVSSTLKQLDTALSNKRNADESVSGGASGDEDKTDEKDFKESLISAGESCKRYALTSKRVAERVGRTLALQLFQIDGDFTEDNENTHRMEAYLKDVDNKFVHPNAVRYFVYALHATLSRSYKQMTEPDAGTLDTMYRAAIQPFDKQETETIETVEDRVNEKNIGRHIGFIYTDKKDRRSVYKEVQRQFEAVSEYALLVAQKLVYEAAISYLNGLSKSLETFYDNFGFYLNETKNKAAEIERAYVNGEGKATRYVCASQKCLQKMLEEMPCSSSDVNGSLSATIYQEIKSYSMMVKPPLASSYFSDLFHDKIMGFWRDNVENTYAEQINMDIISALQAEAAYESDVGLTQEQKDLYAASILEQAERLAAPFIEEPMGEVRHPFKICAYNPVISGDPDSTRRSFVNRHINDALSGQADENVSKYELMVYRAVYNLSAGDLMRFCGPTKTDQHGGIYYAAYIEAISQLGPNTYENKVITPHLDRRWHLPKYMPDLDDRNQRILENQIYTALVWGMLTGKIKQKSHTNACDGHVDIRYSPLTRGAESFVVPNGTPCNELYEVVDALEINPPQVALLLKDMEDTLEREKYSRLDLSETKLINCMNWLDRGKSLCDSENVDMSRVAAHEDFVLKQYAPNQKASVFDLLFWIKHSTPADDFDPETITAILDSMLTMLEKHIMHYSTEKARGYELCYEMLKDQFQLFVNNLRDESVTRPTAAKRLRDDLVEKLAVAVDDRIRENYDLDPRFDNAMTTIYEQALSAKVTANPTVSAGAKTSAKSNPKT